MNLLLHVTPLLFLNLFSYVLIKILGDGTLGTSMLAKLFVLGMLGGCYGLMVLMWLWVGRRYQLSYVYPIVGINYVIAVFVGRLAFYEPVHWQAVVGSTIITFGVALLSTSPHRLEVDKVAS